MARKTESPTGGYTIPNCWQIGYICAFFFWCNFVLMPLRAWRMKKHGARRSLALTLGRTEMRRSALLHEDIIPFVCSFGETAELKMGFFSRCPDGRLLVLTMFRYRQQSLESQPRMLDMFPCLYITSIFPYSRVFASISDTQ